MLILSHPLHAFYTQFTPVLTVCNTKHSIKMLVVCYITESTRTLKRVKRLEKNS